MDETWLPSPVFGDCYEVSDQGRIRSARGIKAQYADKDGYPVVNLHRNGKRKACVVHTLVCRAFHGEAPAGNEVAHANGQRDDCRASNLRWTTRSENLRDKVIHGTAGIGEKHPRAILTAKQVLAIRASDRTAGEWAAELGVTIAAVTDARNGRNWKHLAETGTGSVHESPVAKPCARNPLYSKDPITMTDNTDLTHPTTDTQSDAVREAFITGYRAAHLVPDAYDVEASAEEAWEEHVEGKS